MKTRSMYSQSLHSRACLFFFRYRFAALHHFMLHCGSNFHFPFFLARDINFLLYILLGLGHYPYYHLEENMENQNPFADILANVVVQRKHRLTFEEQCGYFGALIHKVPKPIVAEASGMQIAAVYRLANAGQPPRYDYEKVWLEWQALQGERFIHKYVTPVIRDKLRVAGENIHLARLAPKPFDGFNRRASKYLGSHTIIDRDIEGDPGVEIEIAFDRDPLAPGWKWRLKGDSAWRGDPRCEERGFAFSEHAYQFCKLRFAPTQEQLASGDYDRANDDSYFGEQNSKKSPNARLTSA